jgi:hypothetical protein
MAALVVRRSREFLDRVGWLSSATGRGYGRERAHQEPTVEVSGCASL